MSLTRTIAGRPVTLSRGTRYCASRPIIERGRRHYPVFIWALTSDSAGLMAAPVVTLPGMNYDEANAFLREFNNGKISFEGRIWR
jgi:hypothetical protein